MFRVGGSILKSACLAKNSHQSVYTYSFLVGPDCYNGSTVTCGSCYQTTVGQSDASSPAFEETPQSLAHECIQTPLDLSLQACPQYREGPPAGAAAPEPARCLMQCPV